MVLDNRLALNPARSIVVEACAGSGKTWLLVSRIVRLLLSGVPPGEILAITFTRRAAYEMQERLRDWLYDLAAKDDEFVRRFLIERGVEDVEGALPRARRLYQQFLFARPGITISTFHGWFMQILQRAPLNSGCAGGAQLIEQTSELWQEAWQIFLEGLREAPEGETAQSMLVLFAELGLSNTQGLLRSFADKRSEWWASGGLDAVLENLGREFGVDTERDVVAELFERPAFAVDVRTLASRLNASDAQLARASRLLTPLDGEGEAQVRFEALWDELYTKKNEPRAIKANKGQDEAGLLNALDVVRVQLQRTWDERQTQQIYRFNCHALRCGVGLLDAYQSLKQRQQLLDFGDLEWRVRELLCQSDHAEYMQYKLDSRYRHVLLDEFQDTNPLQWQILQSWFEASGAVDSNPVVFVVGDPKQSIYRFRRADARLFGVVSDFLVQHYAALHLKKNETRRNAPAVLDAVNAVFSGLPAFDGFEPHSAHQLHLPGHVAVLPLAEGEGDASEPVAAGLRNPLLFPCPEPAEGARELEAQAFAEKILEMVGAWQVNDEGQTRRMVFSDIMVLVRRRTHLKVYEQALRNCAIPYLSSRRGGLLDTLEASDIQALLGFLMAPFANLALAHVLRSPIFSCTDQDLLLLAEVQENQRAPSWWSHLKDIVAQGRGTQTLIRAYALLEGWLVFADKLPVHDLLDRIYFEGDAMRRYADASPVVMREAVRANLQAFLEIALDVDAGRYPSLPGFLREIDQLRKADSGESPDEGRVSQSGNAVRIYTVHESKGLEAPVVWLLDTNAKPAADRGCDVLVDWPTGAQNPSHFSLYADKASRGAVRERYFEQEAALAEREDLNLLYVAMTRAKQVLIVSGNGARLEGMWYARIADALGESDENPCAQSCDESIEGRAGQAFIVDERLTCALPVGSKKPVMSAAQRNGVWLHGLLEHLAPVSGQDAMADTGELQRKLGIPPDQADALLDTAYALLSLPHLSVYFDPSCYLFAANELAYVDDAGRVRRIDRLVEFEHEVWVLDYKSGQANDAKVQLDEYRRAMQAVHPSKKVRCGVIFADGNLLEV